MKKYYLLLLLISFQFSCNSTQNLETITLFNGENLDGWIIYGTEKWFVEDKELVCERFKKQLISANYGRFSTF